MQIQFNQYKYSNYSYPINSKTPISFTGGTSTMQEKLTLLLSETKKLYMSKKSIDINDFKTIIKRISPETTIQHFSQIPPGSNISPRTGAYYSQKTLINAETNEMAVENKVIYLNPGNNDSQPKLRLFGDFIHEATHIAQEEATDRLSTIDFTKQLLLSGKSSIAKRNSLLGGVQGFQAVEYNIILPLVEALKKVDDIPVRVPYADKNILNYAYKQLTGYSTSEYIKLVTEDIIGQLEQRLPFADRKYILRYIHKKAGHEKEAHLTGLNFLKDILNIKGDTDLDFKIYLYDEFEKTIGEMLAK